MHHNEVAYPRPNPPPMQRPQNFSRPKYEGSIVDKHVLNEYHQRLAETKAREQALHDEVNKFIAAIKLKLINRLRF